MRWRLLPDSLAGRTIAVMVAGLTLSHLASIGAYHIDLLSQSGTSVEHEESYAGNWVTARSGGVL